MKALRVEQLTKVFTSRRLFSKFPCSVTAVDGISFELAQGEVLGFLGANGSGKTTTIQMLLGVMTPTSGSISYFNRSLEKHRSELLQHIAFASSYSKLPSRLTIEENLDLYGKLYGMHPTLIKERTHELLTYFGMWDMRNVKTGVLSAGQMTRVMLSKAFLARPKVVLLDEPTASLDPDVAHDVRSFVLHQQSQEGVSILFTSHNMDEVAEICSRVLVLKTGKIIADDTPENLAKSIATSHIWLMVGDGLKRTAQYAESAGLKHTIQGRLIEIEIEEHKIAGLLTALAQKGVEYTNISIDKPTLEDYFLHISRKK